MRKQRLFVILMMLLLAGTLTGCGDSGSNKIAGGSGTNPNGDNSTDNNTDDNDDSDDGTDDNTDDNDDSDDGTDDNTDDNDDSDDGTDDTDDPPTKVVDTGENLSYPLQYSDDGATLVMGNRNNNLHVRDGISHELLQTLPSFHDWTQALIYRSNRHQFASAGRDNAIRVWQSNGVALQSPFVIQTPSRVHNLAFNTEREELASANEDGNIYLWDTLNLTKLRTLVGHTSRVYALTYLPDQQRLVSVSGDGTIKLWNSLTGKWLKTIGVHAGAVYDLSLLPDGKSFVTISEDGVIKRWSTTTYEHLESFTTTAALPLYALAVTADGKQMIAGDAQGYIHRWVIGENRARAASYPNKTFQASGSGKIHALAFHPSTQQFSSISEDAIWRLWDGVLVTPIRSQSVLEDYQDPSNPPDNTGITQDSAKALVKLAFRGIQPVFNAGVVLEQPEHLEPYFLAGFLSANQVACPESGTFSYVLDDPNGDRYFSQIGDVFNATVAVCKDGRYVLDGNYALAMQANNRSAAQTQVEGTLNNLRIQVGEEHSTLSGHLLFTNTLPDSSQIAPSSVLQTRSTDLGINLLTAGSILFSNLNTSLIKDTITETQHLTYQASLNLAGSSYNGHYTLTTVQGLLLNADSQYPASGKLSIRSNSGPYAGAEITVTVWDVDKVKIEIDTTSNGSIDYQETVNWSELTLPFTF